MLSSNLALKKANNCHCLLKILSSLKFLAGQGCAIQGHDKSDKTHNEGNLMQLMKLISKDDCKVCELPICDEMYF